ncbi:glycosyltransferase 87 family protein [Streptomyces tropicalis]|uniref:Glycosyltransferase 87 family protein n=1 Tax=Streptomyces tropicalis TaxID=3034234 RepID=A0ABT5ZXL8_9ACTN|nr:glycosyltransferase 87 family protein [Streptomyces tropicalis]MDF3297148.1 glycosyltransferase 87 family protein [Streptomyces tropicalis]
MPGTTRGRAGLLATWSATRLVLLLCVLGVLVLPGPDVTTDVSVIYRGWYEVLRHGAFPLGDVTWQYPPAAALAVVAPGALPFLGYATAFFVLALLADLAVLCLLLRAGRGPGRSAGGAWVWTTGAAVLGPTLYARYDVMVTAVAVAALLAAARHPRAAGVLAGLGALLKVWPALLLVGVARRRTWGAAGLTVAVLTSVSALAAPGALAFLTSQRDRGTEIESLGALVFHLARRFGWSGRVLLRYGSVEFLGPYVDVVSAAALAVSGAALGWLLLWRLRARALAPHAVADAAFTAVLLLTTTSRVISPQYLVWLVGLGAVCRCFRQSAMRWPVGLVLAAAAATVLEFPVFFADVVASDPLGVALLLVRDGLLAAASLSAARRLWRATVPPAPEAPAPRRPAAAGLSPAGRGGRPATDR